MKASDFSAKWARSTVECAVEAGNRYSQARFRYPGQRPARPSGVPSPLPRACRSCVQGSRSAEILTLERWRLIHDQGTGASAQQRAPLFGLSPALGGKRARYKTRDRGVGRVEVLARRRRPRQDASWQRALEVREPRSHRVGGSSSRSRIPPVRRPARRAISRMS